VQQYNVVNLRRPMRANYCGWNYTSVEIHGLRISWAKNVQISAF